jgi:hypothetical protein
MVLCRQRRLLGANLPMRRCAHHPLHIGGQHCIWAMLRHQGGLAKRDYTALLVVGEVSSTRCFGHGEVVCHCRARVCARHGKND